MRLGTFLLGGLMGAAAAIYVTNRTKPFDWSAWTNSDVASSFLSATGMKSANAKSQPSEAQQTSQNDSTTTSNVAQTNKKETVFNEELFKADGLNKVSDIVNQDPKLKAAVDEIMAGNSQSHSQKSQQHSH